MSRRGELRFYGVLSNAYPEDAVLLRIVNDDSEPMVTVRRNGAVEYQPGVDLDEAARDFWHAITTNIPGPLRGCPDPSAHGGVA